MARDIPRTQRSVLESAQSLPQYSGGARLAEMLGGLSNKIGSVATKLSVEQATLEGAKNRMEGGPKKLAPGLNAATQAYNNAFVEMDASLVYTSAIQGMSQDMLEISTPASLAQGGASERYMQLAQARIKGALDAALEQGKPELALKLQQSAHNNVLKLMSMQQNFDYDASKSNGSVVLKQGIDQYKELMRSGYTDIAGEHLADIQQNLKAQKALGYISSYDQYQYEEALKQAGLNGAAEYEYRNLFSESEEAAAKYINEFYGKKMPGVTQEQKEGALQHLLGVHTHMTQAMTHASQIGFDNVSRLINPVEPGVQGPTSIDQVREAIQAQGQQGNPINRHQELVLENQFISSLKSKNKDAQTNAEIVKVLDSPDLVFYAGKPLDKFFDASFALAKEQRDLMKGAATTPSQYLMANTPDWMLAASIASRAKFAPISAYTKYLETQLMNGSVEQKLDAVKAWTFLETNNPTALNQFSAKDQAFVHTIMNRMANTRVPPEVIIKEATDSILKVDEKVYENRIIALRDEYKAKPKFIQNLSSEIFGADIDSKVAEPGSIMYSAVQREFEQNYLISGDRAIAANQTKMNMERMAGKSKFGPKGQPIWNPPERLPFYSFGNIVDNQYAQYINQVARTAQENPGVLPYDIKPSKKMPPIPERLSEEEKMLGNFFKGKGYLNIDGKDVEVFLVSPSFNQANAIGGTFYQLYYVDNGIPKALSAIDMQVGPNGEKMPRIGNALMQFQPPNRYVPGVLNKLQNETADANLAKAAESHFNAITPKEFGSPFDLPTYHKNKPADANKEEFKKYLSSFKEDMPKKIEEEKLKRALANAGVPNA